MIYGCFCLFVFFHPFFKFTLVITNSHILNGSTSRWRSVKGDVPKGSTSGSVLFSIFNDNIGREVDQQLLKFADHKLNGETDTVERRDAIQWDTEMCSFEPSEVYQG